MKQMILSKKMNHPLKEMKQMIKLLKEDVDSFSRMAAMYYKKHPELVKFVEEFYRAYQALTERDDHATGVKRIHHILPAIYMPTNFWQQSFLVFTRYYLPLAYLF